MDFEQVPDYQYLISLIIEGYERAYAKEKVIIPIIPIIPRPVAHPLTPQPNINSSSIIPKPDSGLDNN